MPKIGKKHKPHYLKEIKLKGETFTPVIIGDDSHVRFFCDLCDLKDTDNCGIKDCISIESGLTINIVFQKS